MQGQLPSAPPRPSSLQERQLQTQKLDRECIMIRKKRSGTLGERTERALEIFLGDCRR